jgi:hypothetical protein
MRSGEGGMGQGGEGLSMAEMAHMRRSEMARGGMDKARGIPGGEVRGPSVGEYRPHMGHMGQMAGSAGGLRSHPDSAFMRHGHMAAERDYPLDMDEVFHADCPSHSGAGLLRCRLDARRLQVACTSPRCLSCGLGVGERGGEKERARVKDCVCVCACVCVRARARVRESICP